MDRRVWRATVHRVSKSQIGLKWLSTHTRTHAVSCQGLIFFFLECPSNQSLLVQLYLKCCCFLGADLLATLITVNFFCTPLPDESPGNTAFLHPTLSVQFSCSVMSNSLWPHELQHTRPPCPSPTPGAYPHSCPLSRWCHPTISSSVVPFSSCPQSFPASGSFQMSQLFTWGGQSIGVSASTSVLPMNTQDWSLGWTGWISLQSKGLSRVFSNTMV